jgi:Immunity protein 35
MLTKPEALALVSRKLQEKSPADDEFIVVEKHTIERPFGWVFFFNSKKYLETGINSYRLAGNGPVIVNKHSGAVEFCGTRKLPQQSIDEYERSLS